MPTTKPEVFRFSSQPRLEKPPLVIGWTMDAGDVSRGVGDFLAEAMGGHSFCQIEPTDFFAVGGVTVEGNVAEFPQSRFFHDERNNVLVLRSDEPQASKYEFLGAVLDMAEHYRVESLYTVNGIASMIAHTSPRRAFGVFSDGDIRERLRWYMPLGLSWHGPPHLSTYLLWLAKQRHIPAASLWVEVPFYLADYQDAQAVKTAASLLGHIIGWDYGVSDLDLRVIEQDETLAELRQEDPEIDARIQALEQDETLDTEEQAELVEAIHGALRKHG
jgi:predicted ATP-grasp superfamily ATP-dependent carboligase